MDPLDLEQLLLLPREAFREVMKTKSDEEVTAFNWIMGERLRQSLEKCELELERSERLRTKALELSLVRKQETPTRRFVEPAEDQKLPVVRKHIEDPQQIEGLKNPKKKSMEEMGFSLPIVVSYDLEPSETPISRRCYLYAMDGLGNEGKGVRSRGWVSVSRESGDAEDSI